MSGVEILEARSTDDEASAILDELSRLQTWCVMQMRSTPDAMKAADLVQRTRILIIERCAKPRATPSHEAGRWAGLDTGEFEVWQMVGDDEMMVAGCSGKLDRALAEAMHYAAVYEQDGPVRLEQIIRVSIALPPAIRNLAGDEGMGE